MPLTVNFDLDKGTCVVSSNKKYPVNMRGESALWYDIKKALIEQGHDVVKKRMYKDGPYYIRHRKWQWCLVDNYGAIRFLTKPINEGGHMTLSVVDWRTNE